MSKLSGFLQLLKSPFKIISQNGKLMAFKATLYLIFYTIYFFLFTLLAQPLLLDLTFKLMKLASITPGSPEFTKLLLAIAEDTGIFIGIEAAYVVLFFFAGMFLQTTITIIASCYYSGYDLCLKEVMFTILKTWTRPFITSFWLQLISLGCTSFFLLFFMVPAVDQLFIVTPVLLHLFFLFYTFLIYVSFFWSLGIVLSVVEDSFGFSALGKATEVVNGEKVYGFLLTLFFTRFITRVIQEVTGNLLNLYAA
ncbi:hypothetical protein SSX86_017110 [Deinandra increscens subsp. villosa]|uniref:Uncharacterized protein n=1 Tax=Deinandra increscens subsp. villosa TaxID=3103831 RepID=A0AAP0GY79_9ASTR